MAERITGHTELIGLMAYPIRHSSSPAMHNEAFAYLGLDYAYLAFEVDNSTLEDEIKGLRALKMVGSNVSMPNKTVVGQYLDKLSPAAELCGAVNTIVNENGVLTGHITDGIGFMQSLKDNDIDVIGKKMTIAGAGGAATAIEIQAAKDLGANSRIVLIRIIFPLTLSGVISGIVMVFVPALTSFVISDLLGGGKVLLIGNVIEQEFMQGSNWNLGSGLSVVLMIFVIASMAVMNIFDKDQGGTAVW